MWILAFEAGLVLPITASLNLQFFSDFNLNFSPHCIFTYPIFRIILPIHFVETRRVGSFSLPLNVKRCPPQQQQQFDMTCHPDAPPDQKIPENIPR